MKQKFAGTIKNTINGSQFFKVILYPLQYNHSLTVFILHHRILFKCFRKDINFRKRTDFTNPPVLPIKDFPFTDSDFQLRIECSKETSHHILKTIKNRKSANQRKRSKRHSAHRDAGYDINSIMLFL